MKSNNTLMPPSLMRTLRLKLHSEAYPWLNAAAMEVNQGGMRTGVSRVACAPDHNGPATNFEADD
jgi:hypothetical protein